jgi:hypothetical protein
LPGFISKEISKLLESSANEKEVRLKFGNKKYKLNILAVRHNATGLASPINGFMNGRIKESMTSELHIELIDIKQGKTIFKDVGRHAGLEVAGDIDQITISK